MVLYSVVIGFLLPGCEEVRDELEEVKDEIKQLKQGTST